MNTPFHLLLMSASIQTATYSVDAAGSEYPAYATAKTCQCTVQPMSNRDSQRYGRETGARLSKIFLPPAFDDGTAIVCPKDAKVTVGSVVYRVIGGLQDDAGRGVLFRADLEEIS